MIGGLHITSLVFGASIRGPCSCSVSAVVQLHDPLPQAYFSTMLSKVSFDSMINVLVSSLWTAYWHFIVQINTDAASAILSLAMHIKTTARLLIGLNQCFPIIFSPCAH